MSASFITEPDTERAPAAASDEVWPAPQAPAKRMLPPALRAGTPMWIWIGVGIAIAGFVVVTVAWAQVAGEGQVYRQIPYVLSGGIVGLGLLMIGLTVLNAVSRQRDGLERDRQIAELIRAIEALREAREGGRR